MDHDCYPTEKKHLFGRQLLLHFPCRGELRNLYLIIHKMKKFLNITSADNASTVVRATQADLLVIFFIRPRVHTDTEIKHPTLRDEKDDSKVCVFSL